MHCVTQLKHPFLSSVNTLALNLSLDDPSRHFPTDCPAMVKKYQLVQVVTWWWCNHLVAGAASHLLVPPTEGVRDASFPLQNSPISKSEPTLLSHWLWSNYCCNAFMSFGNWIKLKATTKQKLHQLLVLVLGVAGVIQEYRCSYTSSWKTYAGIKSVGLVPDINASQQVDKCRHRCNRGAFEYARVAFKSAASSTIYFCMLNAYFLTPSRLCHAEIDVAEQSISMVIKHHAWGAHRHWACSPPSVPFSSFHLTDLNTKLNACWTAWWLNNVQWTCCPWWWRSLEHSGSAWAVCLSRVPIEQYSIRVAMLKQHGNIGAAWRRWRVASQEQPAAAAAGAGRTRACTTLPSCCCTLFCVVC